MRHVFNTAEIGFANMQNVPLPQDAVRQEQGWEKEVRLRQANSKVTEKEGTHEQNQIQDAQADADSVLRASAFSANLHW